MAIASMRTGWRVDALRVNAIRVEENQCKEKERKKRLTWLDASAWTCWCAETDWTRMTVRKEKKEKLTRYPAHGW